MGFFSNLFGLGNVAKNIGGAIRENTEVFHVNETEKMHEESERFKSVLSQYGEEFKNEPRSFFGESINGLNRLPRPMMALGTIFLFAFALYDPDRFSVRMIGLQEVPDQLWWLMTAIVSFYFGARELHYFRKEGGARAIKKEMRKVAAAPAHKSSGVSAVKAVEMESAEVKLDEKGKASKLAFTPATSSDNAAIMDWIKTRK